MTGSSSTCPESALVAGAGKAALADPAGEVAIMTLADAARRAGATPLLLCHAPETARRLGLERLAGFDLLELFAFVRPARFCVPTPRGLADATGEAAPETLEDQARLLPRVAEVLLAEIAAAKGPERRDAAAVAATMAGAGWPWGPAVLEALGAAPKSTGTLGGLDVWERLPEWDDAPAAPATAEAAITPAEARQRLQELRGPGAESRPGQLDYAAGAAAAFVPADGRGGPRMVLAEAGTGIGKTLGYIAPASLWTERNDGAVWLSTYTRNLQRQIDGELDRLYPDAGVKAERAVIRKGRENYLCLLNLENAVRRATILGAPGPVVAALGLIARWAGHSRDGDMVGGDFPAWLRQVLGGPARGLTDRRGECVYSACAHYRKCFVERVRRRADRADIVIANHALVMTRAAMSDGHAGQAGHDGLPTHYVFDEGHHLFEAADSAFSAHLSGVETAELRRWIRGPEDGREQRARGLKGRVGDLLADDDEGSRALTEAVRAARVLPGERWLARIAGGQGQAATETFLAAVRNLVLARNTQVENAYSLECTAGELPDDLLAAAQALDAALADLAAPLKAVAGGLAKRLDADAADLETSTRLRIEGACRALSRRLEHTVAGWRAMLGDLAGGRGDDDGAGDFVDWMSVTRGDGREYDVGLHRHWIDPTRPFAAAVLERAHGVVVTSATLRDRAPDAPEDWARAEISTGAHHLALPAERISLLSPFDYVAHTRVFVVTDVNRNNPDQVAAAYRELFLAAGGDSLGLFTSIARLRAVHERLAPALEEHGIPLYAQHVDAMDPGTLVDIFRAEPRSCLLGTDAVRDGIDVPGPSLHQIVFERVPWPRPDILHKARRRAFDGRGYDDTITRRRLQQAFGRLVRQADDRGVFVMLDAAMPSRLAGAFPEGVEPQRMGLRQAVDETRKFLGQAPQAAPPSDPQGTPQVTAK